MNLYLISQNINGERYVYDSAIVCAESEDIARMIHPQDSMQFYHSEWWERTELYRDWVTPEQVIVRLIGIADKTVNKDVLCADLQVNEA